MRMPCGRTTKDKNLCCMRKHHWWNIYWTKHQGGWWELKCLWCKHVICTGGKEMTLGNYIFKNKFLKW